MKEHEARQILARVTNRLVVECHGLRVEYEPRTVGSIIRVIETGGGRKARFFAGDAPVSVLSLLASEYRRTIKENQ